VTSAARLCACASRSCRRDLGCTLVNVCIDGFARKRCSRTCPVMHVPAHGFSCLSLNETRNHAVLGIYAGTSSAQHMARTCVSGTDYKKFRQSNHLAAVATKPVRKWGCGGFSGHSKGVSARVGGRANGPAVRINQK
jgi:hypothetical protein